MTGIAGKTTTRVSLPLPPDYPRDMFLAFHRRDAEEVAEKTVRGGIAKGIVFQGAPACLTITFSKNTVRGVLHCDNASHADPAQLETSLSRMLGLDQPVTVFEAAYREHPAIGPLVCKRAGLRVSQTATPFEAICWAVIGQLVSVGAAISIRRRFIRAVNIRHSSGLYCFPDAKQVLALEEDALRSAGLSRTKASAIRNVGKAVVDGNLPLDSWPDALRDGTLTTQTIREALLAVRGIGPWTVSYVLLRGLGSLDGSLHGDVAVRRNLARLLGQDEKPTEKQTEEWLASFTPWRALVAAHIWAMQATDGY